MPEGIRICTKAEEKENNQAKMQFFDSLLRELATDEKLVETNKMMLLQYAARKSAEEDPIDWYSLERDEGQQGRRRSTRDDHEAGPSRH